MVENYNVTLAEKLIPACDISEQISLASKEASGTGKHEIYVKRGPSPSAQKTAPMWKSEDGANVEIHELVGDDNIFIFGDTSDIVIKRYADHSYHSADYYQADPDLKEAVDFMVGETMMKIGSKEHLERLYHELLNKDWFMTFPDFKAYVAVKNQAFAQWLDRKAWAKKMLKNISEAGYFSSDRTIKEYNRDIWKLS